MTTPSSGPISMGDIRGAIGRAPAPISLGETNVRLLAKRESGAVSIADCRGREILPWTVTGENSAYYARDIGNENYWRHNISGTFTLVDNNNVLVHDYTPYPVGRFDYGGASYFRVQMMSGTIYNDKYWSFAKVVG